MAALTVMTRYHTSWRWMLAAIPFVAACTSYTPPDTLPGMDRAAVIARMGPPDTELRLASGTRLEFPSGPYGKHTWFVYLDAAGRATRAEQVLTDRNFARVVPGMSQDDVRQLLGRPGETYSLARDRGVVWSYRYDNQICLWFQVEIAADKTVRSAGNGPLPECNPRMQD